MDKKEFFEILDKIDDESINTKQNEIIDALGGIKKILGLIVDIRSFFDKSDNLDGSGFDRIIKILNDLQLQSNIDEPVYSEFSEYEYKPLDNLPAATISDECIDHDYDAYILDVDENVLSKSFGLKYNDIAIKSQLIETEKKNYSQFISDIIKCQCSRCDPLKMDFLDISYQNSEHRYIHSLLFNKEEKPKQVIIVRYQSTNADTTNMHNFEITQKMNKNKKVTDIINNFETTKDDHWWPSKLQQIVNLLQFEEIKKEENNSDIPLFIHHFYPKTHVLYIDILQNILDDVDLNVIKAIIEFMFEDGIYMFYDCWYLKRNIKFINKSKVTLCDKLLFNSKHYELINNPYNGLFKLYVPSQHLLNNNNNSLQKIIDEIKLNNILNVFRFIVWGIILNVNPSNKLLAYRWKEDIEGVYLNFARKQFQPTLQFAFSGNKFDGLYALNNLLKVKQFGFKTFIKDEDKFTGILDKKINLFNSVVIPDIHLLLSSFLSDQDLKVWECFEQTENFPINIKCYLVENMFIFGIAALSLNFSAYLKLQSTNLSQFIQSEEDEEDDMRADMMIELYRFNDTKAINELYLKFMKQLKLKQIVLKQNKYLVPYSWYALSD